MIINLLKLGKHFTVSGKQLSGKHLYLKPFFAYLNHFLFIISTWCPWFQINYEENSSLRTACISKSNYHSLLAANISNNFSDSQLINFLNNLNYFSSQFLSIIFFSQYLFLHISILNQCLFNKSWILINLFRISVNVPVLLRSVKTL